ncbi:MAG: copper resistance protein CopC [Candidatus Cloacimonetes bacterium]|nr:copper resistance protein CopC [Candidatus Cloacimonadota bacterium]
MINELNQDQIYINFTNVDGTMSVYDIELETPNGNILEHGNGAVRLLQNLGSNNYRLSLTLNDPLTLNGAYVLSYNLQNSLGGSFDAFINFVFDDQNPLIESVFLGLDNNSFTYLNDGDEVNNGIVYAEAELSDNNSVNFYSNDTHIAIYSAQDELIQGSHAYIGNNRIRITLNNPLRAINRNFYVEVTAEDFAQNSVTERYDFLLNTLQSEFYPPHNSFINEPIDFVAFSFEFSGNLNLNETSLTLEHPDGDIISNNNGAILQVSPIEGGYALFLTLSQPLSEFGNDDGRYYARAMVTPVGSQPFEIEFSFVYDTRLPYFTNLRINDTNELTQVGNSYYYSGAINSVSSAFLDSVVVRNSENSGVDFSSTVTKVFVLDSENNIIDGVRTFDGNNRVKWTLNTPLTVQGDYVIKLYTGDRAGNSIVYDYAFTLLQTSAPILVNSYPSVNGVVASLLDNAVSLLIEDRNGYGLDLDASSVSLTDLATGTVYSDGNNALLTINEGTLSNRYVVSLELFQSLSDFGANDGLYQINYSIFDNINQQLNGTYQFTYDTVYPTYEDPVVGNNSGDTTVVQQNDVISHSINYASVEVNDENGINFDANLTNIYIKKDDNILPGSRTVTGNVITWNLTNPILNDGSDDGDYKLEFNFIDLAGNGLTVTYDFSIYNPVFPVIIPVSPLSQSNVNEIVNNQIVVEISDEVGINMEDLENNGIIFTKADGEEYSSYDNLHNFQISPSRFGYVFTLTLENPLNSDGSDDGVCSVKAKATNIYGYFKELTYQFRFDTQAPILSGLYLISSDDEQIYLGNNMIAVHTDVTKIRIIIEDNGAGIAIPVDGDIVLSNDTDVFTGSWVIVDDNTFDFVLTEPIYNQQSSNGDYQLNLTINDVIENSLNTVRNFEFSYLYPNAQLDALPVLYDNLFVSQPFSSAGFQINNSGIDLDLTDVRLVHVNSGEEIYTQPSPGYGAVNDEGFMNLVMDLDNELLYDGTDDDLYEVRADIFTTGGDHYYLVHPFIYDTQLPVVSNYRVNDYQINAYNNIVQTSDLEYVQVEVTDITAGVELAYNLTHIYLVGPDGNEITGTITKTPSAINVNNYGLPLEANLRLDLDEPINVNIATAGEYVIKVKVGDYANNNSGDGTIDIPFILSYQSGSTLVSITPAEDTYVNQAGFNTVTVTVEDEMGFNLDNFAVNYLRVISPNGVLYKHANLATQTFTHLNDDIYQISLVFDYPLPHDGSEDGLYNIQIGLMNITGSVLEFNSQFTYDSLAPVLISTFAGQVSDYEPFMDNDVLYGEISYLRVSLSDATSPIDWEQTEMSLNSIETSAIVTGNLLKYPNQNVMAFVPTAPLTLGQYELNVAITDMSGNILSKDLNFTKGSNIGQFVSYNPERSANINQPINSVSTVFRFPGEGLDEMSSYLKVIHPDGNEISQATGATFAINQNGENYELSLTFNQPLTVDGEDDGTYQVQGNVVTNDGQTVQLAYSFLYDTGFPYHKNLKINETANLIELDDRGRNSSRGNRNRGFYFTSTINSIQVDFDDIYSQGNDVSGVDFAPNISKIFLQDENGTLIAGNRVYNNNQTVKWELEQPLSQDGTYIIQLRTGDKAGNYYSNAISFTKFTPDTPEIISHTPADNANINTLANNRVVVQIRDNNGFGLDQNASDIFVAGPNFTYSNGNGAELSITSVSAGVYNVTLTLETPLSAEGIDDGVYTVVSNIFDNFGSTIGDEVTFLYDTQEPIVTDQALNLGDTQVVLLAQNIVVNDSFDNVSINVSDVTAGVNFNSQDTYVRLYSQNNELVPGTRVVENNTIRWILDEVMEDDGSDDGSYYVKYNIVDYANNSVTQRFDFDLTNPLAPQFVSSSPEDNAQMQMLTPNEVTVIVSDSQGIDTNFEETFIKINTPNGLVIQHDDPEGTVLTITPGTDNQYEIKLSLTEEFEVDGVYIVQVRATNVNGYSLNKDISFTLDSTEPEVQSVVLGLSNGETVILNEDDIVYLAVNYVEATLTDALTGVLIEQSTIHIYDSGDNMLEGELTINAEESKIRYTLDEPLSTLDFYYYVEINTEDEVGNEKEEIINFQMYYFGGEVLEFYPEHNSYVSETLDNVYLKVNVELNQSGTYIQMRHPSGMLIGDPSTPNQPSGAVMEITEEEEGIFMVKLQLNQPLSELGDDDGSYHITANLVTALNQEVPLTFRFVYDRVKPAYSQLSFDGVEIDRNESIEKSRELRKIPRLRELLRDSRSIHTEPISEVSVVYTDLTSGVVFANNLTSLTVLDENNFVYPGTRIVEGNEVIWDMSSAPLDQEGNYKIKMKATDRAGNILNEEYDFSIVHDATPNLISYTPEVLPAYMNSLSPAEFTAVFRDEIGLINNPNASYIRLLYPNGDVAQHPHGGDQTITQSEDEYTISFTLDGELHTNGEDDGIYSVQIRAANAISAFDTTLTMIYDTVKPFVTSVSVVGQTETEYSVEDNSEINDGITSVKAIVEDYTAGIYNIAHLSQIILTDADGATLEGVLTATLIDPNEKKVQLEWTLDTALLNDGTNDGKYFIKIEASDKAGNGMIRIVPVYLFTPLAPQNFVWAIDAVYNVHMSWDYYNPENRSNMTRDMSKDMELRSTRGLLGYVVYRKYNNDDWISVATTADNFYVDNLKLQPDGVYQYKINAVYTVGISPDSPDAMTDQITMDRFVDVIINVSLQNADNNEGVSISIVGDDGLYNMEFFTVTPSSGTVNFFDVFKERYIVTLEKEGFETVIDTIVVSNENNEFSYILGNSESLNSFIPQVDTVYQNYPNPFNPVTTIKFGLKEESKVDLVVYNIKGERVKNILSMKMNAGIHTASWNGTDTANNKVSSGMYLYKFTVQNSTGTNTLIRKMVLMK